MRKIGGEGRRGEEILRSGHHIETLVQDLCLRKRTDQSVGLVNQAECGETYRQVLSMQNQTPTAEILITTIWVEHIILRVRVRRTSLGIALRRVA